MRISNIIQNKFYWAVLFLAIGLTSCQDVIDLDLPDSEPLIIINGRVTDTEPVFVEVLVSGNYFTNDSLPGIPNLTVKLYENNGLVATLAESPSLPGRYFHPFTGTQGNDYHIVVEVPTSSEYFPGTNWRSAPETMNRVFPIDSLYSKKLPADPPFREEGYYLFAHFTETKGIGDNYRLKMWRNDSLLGEPFNLTVFGDDPNTGGRPIDGLTFDDKSLLGPSQLTQSPSQIGWKYTVEVSSVSLQHREYIELLRQQTAQVGSPFDPPPSPIVGNIYEVQNVNNFGLGYFCVSKLSIDSAEVIQ